MRQDDLSGGRRLAVNLADLHGAFAVRPGDAKPLLLQDLDRVPEHKLWIFLNCFAPSNQDRVVITRRVRGKGHTVVWIYAAGLLKDGKLDAAAASELTGISLAVKDVESPLAVGVTETHPLTEGLFETVYGAPGTSRRMSR